jgi:hypothetical protein
VRPLGSCWPSSNRSPGGKSRSVFPGGRAVENPMLASGFAFHPWPTPRAQEQCMTATKARGVGQSCATY